MNSQTNTLDHGSIVVGQPLPFSVYSADRKLLLAKGAVVESERIRDSLLRVGRYQSDGVALTLSAANAGNQSSYDSSEEKTDKPPVESPLDVYARDYGVSGGNARVGVRLSRDENSESFPCWILGADEHNGLIVSAPAKGAGSIVAVTEGQTWVFRTMYLTAAVKFTGVIRKVQFDPVPALNIASPKQVELRHVRSSPRVSVCIRGTIDIGKEVPMLVIDVSANGLRIALERKHCEIKMGERAVVSFTVTMLGRDYSFKLPVVTINRRNEIEQRHPALWVVGVKIESQTEVEKLVLHSYVYERMMLEFNPLWRLLVQG